MDRPTTKKSNRQITSRGQLDDEIEDFINLFVNDYKITSKREIKRISKRATRQLVELFEASGDGVKFKKLSAVIRREFRGSQLRTFPDLPNSIYISGVGQIAERVGEYDIIAKEYKITSKEEIQYILGLAVTELMNDLNTTGIFDYSHLRAVVMNKYLAAVSALHHNKPLRKIQSKIVDFEKTQRYVLWKLTKLRQAEAKLLL